VGGVGLEALLEGAEDGGNAFDMDEAAVFLENFEKAAHVCAFKLVGQIDGEGDGGDRVLGSVSAVAHENGVAKSFYANLIDSQIAGIGGGLCIVEWSSLNRAIFQSVNRLTESRVRAKARRINLDL